MKYLECRGTGIKPKTILKQPEWVSKDTQDKRRRSGVYGKAECPVCQRETTVNGDGTLRRHREPDTVRVAISLPVEDIEVLNWNPQSASEDAAKFLQRIVVKQRDRQKAVG